MIIDTVIIEDVIDSRDTLIRLLNENCTDVNIVGYADSVDTGYNLIKNTNPKLVFMDIQLLGHGTGFDILKKLHKENSISFEVIFFTGFATYENATKAIKYSALEFLEKPVNKTKLADAVSKAQKKLANQNKLNSSPDLSQITMLLQTLSTANSKSKNIGINLIKGVIEFVDIEKIIYLEADGTMSKIYIKDKNMPLNATKNLGYYGKLLKSDYNFFPISNKTLVNMDYVKQYDHRETTVKLTNGNHLLASRRGGQDFRRYINDNKNEYGDLEKRSLTGLLKKLLGGD